MERMDGVTHLKAPVKRKKYSPRKKSIFFPSVVSEWVKRSNREALESDLLIGVPSEG